MTKTSGIYAREIDIGYPEEDTTKTEVQNLSTIVEAIDTTVHNIEEAVEELKKIKRGTGLNIGVDLDEEAE